MALVDQSLPYVRAISPYQPGKPIAELAREQGVDERHIIKLASNENPRGMSPRARAAMERALGDLERYPDGNGFALKAALAERHGVGVDQIALGNGSNDLLELVARVFLAPGRGAVFSRHAFAVYPLATLAAGGECIEVPARDYGHDLDAMAAAIGADTRIVFVANPNNPTGTHIPPEALHAFLARVPADVLVVLDEAYHEYLPPELRSETVGWLRQFPNLLISRTFSKIYGMAGLRIGYALAAAEVVDLINRVRQPFNVNSLAQAAALGALEDHGFVAESYAMNRAGMELLVAGLKRLGLGHLPSQANFVTFKVGNGVAVNARLLAQGVIVRPIASYGMPEWLRVTVGTEPENARFLAALEKAL